MSTVRLWSFAVRAGWLEKDALSRKFMAGVNGVLWSASGPEGLRALTVVKARLARSLMAAFGYPRADEVAPHRLARLQRDGFRRTEWPKAPPIPAAGTPLNGANRPASVPSPGALHCVENRPN
jgi:hypothetical protein